MITATLYETQSKPSPEVVKEITFNSADQEILNAPK